MKVRDDGTVTLPSEPQAGKISDRIQPKCTISKRDGTNENSVIKSAGSFLLTVGVLLFSEEFVVP